jgi:Threonine dehydrogenase and related Zn-dependent dehydrogenases
MKGLITDGKGKFWITGDIPVPVIGDYDALTENIACGICNSTDLKLIDGHVRPFDTYPAVLGHEVVGRVIETGRKASFLKKGDIVLRSYALETLPRYNSLWGGFTEYGMVTDYKAILEDGFELKNPAAMTQQVVPEGIDPAGAVMIITLKEVQSALDRLGFQAGMKVAVAGCGPVGLAMVRLLKLNGADKILLCGHHDTRLEKAGELGAHVLVNSNKEDMVQSIKRNMPDGVDMFIDAAGSNHVVDAALQTIKDDGIIGLYGIGMKAGGDINWERGPYNFKIVSVQWPICERESAVHEKVIEFIQRGDIDLYAFVSHVLDLDRYQEGFDLVASRKGFKVVLKL